MLFLGYILINGVFFYPWTNSIIHLLKDPYGLRGVPVDSPASQRRDYSYYEYSTCIGKCLHLDDFAVLPSLTCSLTFKSSTWYISEINELYKAFTWFYTFFCYSCLLLLNDLVVFIVLLEDLLSTQQWRWYSYRLMAQQQ